MLVNVLWKFKYYECKLKRNINLQNTSVGCECTEKYYGPHCETRKLTCDETDCMNGGICVPTTTGTICNCSRGYTGDNCKSEIDECESNPCQYGNCNSLHQSKEKLTILKGLWDFSLKINIMNRMFKWWLSTMLLISIQGTITSNNNSYSTHQKTFVVVFLYYEILYLIN